MPKKGRRQKPERQPQQQTDPGQSVGVQQTGGDWKFHAVALLVICGLTAAIYSNSLKGEFVFDDHISIDENPFILRVTTLDWQPLYDAATMRKSPRPLAYISFALNHRFGGLNVTGYHLVNIVVHILAGICVYFLAHVTYRLLFSGQGAGVGSQGSGDRSPPSTLDTRHSTLDTRIAWMSLFAACIFVAHPVQTQAVTYIVQRMTSMATMFYLASLLLYIYGRISEQGVRRWLLWTGCLITWVLALGSKQIAATLPLVIVLYEWYFFQDLSRLWLRRSLKYFVGLAVVLAFVTLAYLGTDPAELVLSGYKRRDFTMGERVLTQFRVVIYYISLIALPLPSRLNLLHHVSTSRSLVEPITTLLSMLTIAGLMGLAVEFARRERLISFCILWFFLNLAIESSVVALEMVFEHRLYLPMFAVALALPYLVYRLLSKQPAAALLAGAVIVLALGIGTYKRNQVWSDEITLWSDVIDKNPHSHRAYNNLGKIMRQQGKIPEALKYFHRALEINPNYADAYSNLGAMLRQQGHVKKAIQYYHRALELEPEYVEAHYNLAVALQSQNKIRQAIERYDEVLRIQPHFMAAHYNLGRILQRQGKIADAIVHFRQAAYLKPDFVLAHKNLSTALDTLAADHANAGQFDEAIEAAAEAIEAATAAGNQELAREIDKRLESYRNQLP